MRNHSRVFACAAALSLIAAFASPQPVMSADDDKKTKTKEKEKDDGIKWTNIMSITADLPSTSGGTYAKDWPLSVTEKLMRVKVKFESNDGKGGNMTITLFKTGKPPKKIPLMKANRAGEEEKTLVVEPGEYKLEVTGNNISGKITIEGGSKK